MRSHTVLTWPTPRHDPERLQARPIHPREGLPFTRPSQHACVPMAGQRVSTSVCGSLPSLVSDVTGEHAGGGDTVRVPVELPGEHNEQSFRGLLKAKANVCRDCRLLCGDQAKLRSPGWVLGTLTYSILYGACTNSIPGAPQVSQSPHMGAPRP